MRKENPIKEERIKNLKKAKELPLGRRIQYYFDFFKIPMVVLLFLGIISFFFVKDILLAKDTALSIYVVNRQHAVEIYDDSFIKPFCEYAGINASKENVVCVYDFYIDENNADTAMKLVASVSAGECDILICNRDTFNELARMKLLYNLSEYDDGSLISNYSSLLIDYDYSSNKDPEDDSFGIRPLGIDISASQIIQSASFFNSDEEVILCIGNGSKRVERTKSFLQWLLK